jgi:hypothetical protein
VQTCIVQLLRTSLDFVSWKDRKAVAAALKDIYRALDPAAAEAALAAFEAGPWGRKYVAIGQAWRRAWGEVVPFYAFPGEVRRILYTTNAIEALNAKLRSAVRARGVSIRRRPPTEVAVNLPCVPTSVLWSAVKDGGGWRGGDHHRGGAASPLAARGETADPRGVGRAGFEVR